MSSEMDWPRLSLKDAGVTLIDCDHRTPPATGEGYPYIAIPQLKNGHIDLDGVRRISREHFLDWTKKLKPQADDVIVVRRCNSGDSAVVPKALECAIGQNLVILRTDGRIVYPKFLRWLIRSPDWWDQVSKFINVGAVFDSLKCKEIPHFQLTIPPMSAQIEIAGVLNALDNRISLLRETNATLEAIAQALFKSWFVDFDPVHAKQQGRVPEGMDETTATLFPDCFEESKLGLVPMGWGGAPIYELATYINGAAYKAFEPNSEHRGFPIIKIAELKAGVTSQTAYSEVAMPWKYRIDTGDILFSWSGNPDTSIDTFVWLHGQAWLNQHIFRVIPRAVEARSFVLQMLKYLRPIFAEVARNKQTTGLGHVTVADLKRLYVIQPDKPALKLFHLTVAPVQERILENEKQAQTLASLRDILLPRLISGQLRLPEAEEIVKEVY
jgi:type I restriction enzyme S subunit